jgi:hypothetical protein
MKKIPFPFILDMLHPLQPVTKPMFGCHAIYVREKIMLILRDKEDHPDANGMWMAISTGHHDSLRKEFPTMHSVYILSEGKGETKWQMIHVDDEHFESLAVRACELILRGDPRIGKIPKSRKKKAAVKMMEKKLPGKTENSSLKKKSASARAGKKAVGKKVTGKKDVEKKKSVKKRK